MPAIVRNGHIYGASPMFPIGAGDIDYNNTSSELESTNVQDAVDELKGIIDANPGTTYTLDTDGNNITLTPSDGQAQSITAPYATSAGDASTVNGKTVAVNVPADAVFTDTTYENATTSIAGLMSSTDKGKVDALGTASTKDVPTSGNASTTEVVLGNDTRLSDARPASDVSAWAKASTKPSYTANEVGAIATTAKGANGGVAELDSTGKVPSSQLPSYVDDVLEYDSLSDFPLTGEAGKIYVAKDTNKTYRWSGSNYAEISESLALGETSSTAYAGNKGKANADAIAAIKDGTNIDSFSDVENAISTLQSNFQDGVDDVYDAVVAKGSTPASKSLSDVVTGIANIPNSNSGTYSATARNAAIDMGQANTYRYVNTNEVPNSNSGTYDVTSNGVKDMGTTNDKRYVNVNVPNSNSGTYSYASGSTGGTVDMGATNSNRYVNADNVYAKGKADGKADHSSTYAPTSRASNLDMGQTHGYRYVNTNGVPNSNSGTYAVTSNGVKDMGADNTQRYVDVNVPNSNSGTASYTDNGIKDMGASNSYRYVNINVPHPTHTTTYTPTSRASNNDMGATHSYRYVDTRSVPNSNSGTYTPAGNAIYDMGATNDKRYCDGRTAYSAGYSAKRAELTGTYKPTSRASNLDMGSNHTYRYVNTNSVPNSNSGTYATVTTNGTHDMGATNSYRYVTVNVPHPTHTTTYTPTSRASNLDMGATHNYRYVNTNSVPNSNSGTYGSVTSNGVKDMGATNTYRYCNINVPNSNSGTYTYASGSTGGTVDMGATNSYRYVNAANVYAKGKADGKGEVSVDFTYVGFVRSGNVSLTLSPGEYVIVGNSSSATFYLDLIIGTTTEHLHFPIYQVNFSNVLTQMECIDYGSYWRYRASNSTSYAYTGHFTVTSSSTFKFTPIGGSIYFDVFKIL